MQTQRDPFGHSYRFKLGHLNCWCASEGGHTYTVESLFANVPREQFEPELSKIGQPADSVTTSCTRTGESPIGWISSADVAQFLVASLNTPGAGNATLELSGPEALSPCDVVRIFEEAAGKPFEVQHVPVEALEGQLAAATDPMQKSAAALMLGYAFGKMIDMSATLKAFPMKLKSVEEYARSVVG